DHDVEERRRVVESLIGGQSTKGVSGVAPHPESAWLPDSRESMAVTPARIALPYRFDTSNVWHSILKLVFGLNALLVVSIGFAAFMRPWLVTLTLAIVELMVASFTRLLFRFQEGSVGTLYADRVDVDPNVLLTLRLPGPRGSFAMDRFASIRVEF